MSFTVKKKFYSLKKDEQFFFKSGMWDNPSPLLIGFHMLKNNQNIICILLLGKIICCFCRFSFSDDKISNL